MITLSYMCSMGTGAIFGGRLLKRSFLFAIFVGAANALLASGSVSPELLFDLGCFRVTNTMLTMAVFTLVFIFVARFVLLRGGAKLVPSNGQLFFETIAESLSGILEMIMGKRAFKGAAPFLFCLFTYILVMNWSGLLPGVGSVGVTESAVIAAEQVADYEHAGFHVAEVGGELRAERFAPIFRPATSDLNMTFALSLMSFFLFFYFVKKYAGFGALYQDWFGNKADKNDVAPFMYYALFPVFFAVGFIEVISVMIRPLSLSFRLFGNVYGGETLLANMHHLAWGGGFAQIFTWLVPLPFYFLELLIGLIQAFVFTLLTAIYIGLITNHGDAEEGH